MTRGRLGRRRLNSGSLGPKNHLNGTCAPLVPIVWIKYILEVIMTAPHSGAGGRIVVGVDGSASSDQALRWAAEEARARGSRLEVIQAWEGRIGVLPPRSASDEPFERQANEILSAAVTGLPNDERPANFDSRAVQGKAAAALIDESAGADLLVVGAHGHGGVAGSLLGSVSRRVAEHAHCPVVIVRESR
jgi:nucleotide-binding universal stress UspA family protein